MLSETVDYVPGVGWVGSEDRRSDVGLGKSCVLFNDSDHDLRLTLL